MANESPHFLDFYDLQGGAGELFYPGSPRGDTMGRAPASHAERSGNQNLMGSNPNPMGLNPGQVKPMTLNLIYLSLPSLALGIIRIGKGLVGSVSG